ncbi:MAG: HypC/HybG/HupF family hydrogenase formation chaperone [Chloroflexota bacterium]
MCLMLPARVTSVEGDACDVDLGGRVDRVSAVLADDLQVGDWVLVNGGIVVRRLDAEQAQAMNDAMTIVFRRPTTR